MTYLKRFLRVLPVVAVTVVMTLALAACGEGPEKVAENYISAAKNGNYEKAYDLLATNVKEKVSFEEYKSQMERGRALQENVGDMTFNMKGVEMVDESTAYANVEVNMPNPMQGMNVPGAPQGETLTQTMKTKLVKEGSKWRVEPNMSGR